EGTVKRARVERLLAGLEAAGQTAATERKRAEVLLASWETAAAEPMGEDAGTARQVAETRAAERARAETLLGTWRDAETTAAAERARAEALLATLRAADERAALERAVVPRRKPAPEVQDQPEAAAPETEALAPAPVAPADAAATPAAPEQLAALPDPGSAADPATAAALGAVPAEPGDETSFQAVETFLRERDDEFRKSLERYIAANNVDCVNCELTQSVFRVWIRDIGWQDGLYRMRVMFENVPNTGAGRFLLKELIVLLRIDGGDFEIVGHEFPT
ncbi:MAG: hypothetical protein V3T66_05940, partial [Alphaproteobacteria bacterium]